MPQVSRPVEMETPLYRRRRRAQALSRASRLTLSTLPAEIKMLILEFCLFFDPSPETALILSKVSKDFNMLHHRLDLKSIIEPMIDQFLPAAILLGNLHILKASTEDMKVTARRKECGSLLRMMLGNISNDMLGRAYHVHIKIEKMARIVRLITWHYRYCEYHFPVGNKAKDLSVEGMEDEIPVPLRHFISDVYKFEIWPKLDEFFSKKDIGELIIPCLAQPEPLKTYFPDRYNLGINLRKNFTKQAIENVRSGMSSHIRKEKVMDETVRPALRRAGFSMHRDEKKFETAEARILACIREEEVMELDTAYRLLVAVGKGDLGVQMDIFGLGGRRLLMS